MSKELRVVALRMLSEAHKQRNEAEWRLWTARDEETRQRLLYLEAQSREAIAQRDYDRAQDLLEALWSDAKVGPDAEASASDVAALGPNADSVPQSGGSLPPSNVRSE